MSFLKLPLELVQRIVKETIPESIENVALACHALHDASKIYLEEHNRLRKRFRHFEFSQYIRSFPTGRIRGSTFIEKWDSVTNETGFKITSPIELILEIIRNPLIARYIVTADLKRGYGLAKFLDDVDLDSNGRGGEPLFPRIKDQDDVEALRSFLCESPYILEAGVDPEVWLHGMLEDTAGHSDVLLLTLLSRIRELAPSSDWDALFGRNSAMTRYLEDEPRSDRAVIWPMLDVIVRRANDASIRDAGLSRMQLLRPFAGTGYESKNRMTVTTPFLAINSLREAYIGSCIALDDGYTGEKFDPEHQQYSSALEKLELVGCTFGSSEMRELLSRVPALKCFHFAYETKWHGCGHDVDGGAVLNTIMECVGGTLEELSFWMITHFGSTGRTLMDMKGFKRLKTLHLDGNLLTGGEFSKNDAEADIQDVSSGHVDDLAVPRLVDMLPPTIEVVRIQMEPMSDRESDKGMRQRKCLALLFDRFLEEKDAKLPDLKDVTVIVLRRDLDPDLQRELEAKGAKVVLNESAVPPGYVRDFHTRFGV